MNDYLENVLENTLRGREAVEDSASQKARNRRLLRYAEENRKKKRAESPVSPEEEKLLEDVLQEFFA